MNVWSASVSISDGVFVQALPDGESVILNLGNEMYYGLDPVGTTMWSALVDSKSVEGALTILLSCYDVDEPSLRNDLADFVHALEDRDLVDVVAA